MAAPRTRPSGLVYIKSVASTAYEPGDLLYDNGSNAVLPASSQADQLSEAANQRLFAQNFVGVSNGKKLSTDSGTDALPVIAGQDQEIQFTAVSDTYSVGDLLGADEAASGTALEAQQVKKVLDLSKAIAIVTEATSASATKVWGLPLGKFNPLMRANDLQLWGSQDVAMGDAAHALVMTTAGAGQTRLTSNVVFVDPESSGASEDLTLPAEAESDGLVLFIFNTGGEGIVVKDDAGGTVATLLTAEHCIVGCNGTAWKGLVGAET